MIKNSYRVLLFYNFSMRNIIITGAANGMGFQTALDLKQKGDNVFAFDIVDSNNDNVETLKSKGINYYSLDLTNIEKMHKVVEPIVSKHKIDILINFAGIIETGAMIDVPYERMLKSMEINLLAPSELIKIVSKNMNLDGNPRVINMSSVAGYSYRPMWAWYSISKHAMEAMSDAYRIELSKFGIKVIVVQPSSVKTDLAKSLFSALDLPWNKDSVYKKQLDIVAERQNSKSATTVEEMVELIVSICDDPNPKTRYKVGHWAEIIWEDSRKSDEERDDFYIKLLELDK